MITDKDEYYRQKAMDFQSRVVNYRSSTTMTSDAYVWTYRTTNCDVVSIITTVLPVKDGLMKDVKINMGEAKRLKPPNSKRNGKDLLANSPYDFGLNVDIASKRKRMNKTLQDEKREFMSKLQLTRFVRSKLENDAATKLQALYRGYYIRNNTQELQYYASVHQMIRSNLRSYLHTVGYVTPGLHQFKLTRNALRNKAAELIQSGFYRYLARCTYRRKQYERYLTIRITAATKIQAMIRGMYARVRIRALMAKNLLVKQQTSVIKIQRTYRALIARRRVQRRRFKLRWIASKIIQSWYRATYSRRIAMHIKNVMQYRRAHSNALKIQLFIRKFLSKRRVFRIRFRALCLKIFKATTRIQTMIRKFLAKCVVRKKRAEKTALLQQQETLRLQELEKQQAESQRVENEQLLLSSNMFLQAELGHLVEVEDIYQGLLTGEKHEPDEVNPETGESLLFLAARKGYVDLIRKCLLWGFDINARNDNGHHAIMVAAKNDHFPVVQYLTTFLVSDPSAAPTSDTGSDNPLADVQLLLTEDDIGYLYVMAVANTAINQNNMQMLNLFLSLGLNINADSAFTNGMRAIHTACEIGNEEVFQFLLKNKSKYLDAENNMILDDIGQSCLHKACSSSHQIVYWILGLDPNFHIFMNDSHRVPHILLADIDNKTPLLMAILSGQTKVVYLLEFLIAQEGKFVYETYNPDDPLANLPAGTSIPSIHSSSSTGSSDEITWTLPDIYKVFLLVKHSNLYCMKKLIDVYQYDVNWILENPHPDEPRDATYEEFYSKTLMMISCQLGDLSMLDLLMNAHGNMSMTDSLGQNVFHYCILHHATHGSVTSSSQGGGSGVNSTEHVHEINELLDSVAGDVHDTPRSGGNVFSPRNKEPFANKSSSSSDNPSLMAFILLHPQRLVCQITSETVPKLLLQVTNEQENIFHLAAKFNHSYEIMKLDLFFNELMIHQALSQRNNQLMTPFLVACAHQHLPIMLYYLKLLPGVIQDQIFSPILKLHRTGLWYLFHTPDWVKRSPSSPSSSSSNKRSFISEYHIHGPNSSGSTNLSKEEMAKIQQEIAILMLFLKQGNHLYIQSEEFINQDAIITYQGKYEHNQKIPEHIAIGDILIQEYAYTCLKVLIMSNMINYHDAWRLVLASLRYDTAEGSMKTFQYLLRCGVLEIILQEHSMEPGIDNLSAPSFDDINTTESTAQSTMASIRLLTKSSSVKYPARTASTKIGPTTTVTGGMPDNATILRLQGIYYEGLNIMGWCIRWKHIKCMQWFMKKGYDITVTVDTLFYEPALHFAVYHGTPEMVDVLKVDKRLRWEHLNDESATAAMIAAKIHNIKMAKKLFENRANARKALEGRYAGWVLAWVKKLERNEINTQTGRTGEDDIRYFQSPPEAPFFSFWYSS